VRASALQFRDTAQEKMENSRKGFSQEEQDAIDVLLSLSTVAPVAPLIPVQLSQPGSKRATTNEVQVAPPMKIRRKFDKKYVDLTGASAFMDLTAQDSEEEK
jgi:hypothetical protein